IVPGLVGSTETIELVDDAAIAVVDDQRCGRSRAAAKDDLVLRADRQSLRARAAGRGRNRERLLDMERRVLGNLENDARTSSAAGCAGDLRCRDGEVERLGPRIELALLDAVGGHLRTGRGRRRKRDRAVRVITIELDLLQDAVALRRDEGQEIIGG